MKQIYSKIKAHLDNNKKNKEKKKCEDQLIKLILDHEKETNSHVFFIVDKFWIDLPEGLKEKIIDIDDDEGFLKWVYDKFDSNKDIELFIYSSGGTIRASDYIYTTFLRYQGSIKAYIPYYANSAAAMIAIACKEIYMNPFSHIGPVDAQCVYKLDSKKYISTYEMFEMQKIYSGKKMSPEIFLAIQNGIKYHDDNIVNLKNAFEKKGITGENIEKLLDIFASGKYPHHKPYYPDDLNSVGLGINVGIPEKNYEIFKTYLEWKDIISK